MCNLHTHTRYIYLKGSNITKIVNMINKMPLEEKKKKIHVISKNEHLQFSQKITFFIPYFGNIQPWVPVSVSGCARKKKNTPRNIWETPFVIFFHYSNPCLINIHSTLTAEEGKKELENEWIPNNFKCREY